MAFRYLNKAIGRSALRGFFIKRLLQFYSKALSSILIVNNARPQGITKKIRVNTLYATIT